MNPKLPPYVEFGARETTPSPFECNDGQFRGLVLEGDAKKIEDLCQRMLTVPARGMVEYRPLGHYVVLVVGPFAELRSMAPGFNAKGFVKETQLSLWLPLAAGNNLGGLFVPERFVMACPYVFVDNPMSLLNGREEFGYAKAMGKFEPSNGLANKVEVTTFGGNFAQGNQAGWDQLLQVELVNPGAPPGGPIEGPAEAMVVAITKALSGLGAAAGAVVLFVEGLLGGEVNQVVLKQFRDAANSTSACYQAVVEVPVVLSNVSLELSLSEEWQVTVTPLDSHPIDEELGVQTQTTLLSFTFGANMILEPGQVVAP